MKIEINQIEREVEILPAPKGTFFIDEGLCFPVYPNFVAFCTPIDGERNYGNILVCPISFSSCYEAELLNEFGLEELKILTRTAVKDFDYDIVTYVNDLTTDLLNHKIIISSWCYEAINKIKNGIIKSVDELKEL